NTGARTRTCRIPTARYCSTGFISPGGIDWSLEPRDQFFYMWVAITRKTIDGEVVGSDQKLTREEALRFHTIWAAYSTYEENVKGTLELESSRTSQCLQMILGRFQRNR